MILVMLIVVYALFINPSGREQFEKWIQSYDSMNASKVSETLVKETLRNGGKNVIPTDVDGVIQFPVDRYPETALHIQEAIADGHSAVCTIDRSGAEENRKDSLRGVPTQKGKDRDEWPMAMCSEGGTGADIKHISPSDNRGAGAWVSNQLEEYPDGSKIYFLVE